MPQEFTNLFSALSRYSCKPEKKPTENFCTELLAWCCTNSQEFREGFLNLAQVNVQKGTTPEIDTQVRFKKGVGSLSPEDEEGESEVASKHILIPDVVLRSGASGFLVLVESKIEADFGDGQLENYAELLNLDEFSKYDQRGIFVLTKYGAGKSGSIAGVPVRSVRWCHIHDLLGKVRPENEGLKFVFSQFAEFLEDHGMKALKIQKITASALPEQMQGLVLRQQLDEILNAVREALKFSRKKPVETNISEKGGGVYDVDIGMYLSYKPEFWVGFRVKKKPLGLFLLVSRSMPGSREDWKLKSTLLGQAKQKPCCTDGETYFDFEQVVDRNLNGDAEAMLDWLTKTARAVMEEFAPARRVPHRR